MSNNLVLTCYNNHSKECGDPPQLTTESQNKYLEYFQNEHGEQWVYVYDYGTNEAMIMGGDAGWDKIFPVINGKAPALILNEKEKKWLEACWKVSSKK